MKKKLKKHCLYCLLKLYSKKHYSNMIENADKIIGEIDKKDADILALSLKENCSIWSEDKDFRDLKDVNLIRTKDLI